MSSLQQITTITGQRKTLHPVIDGYIFHRYGGSQTLYQCKHKACSVRIRVNINEMKQFELIGFIDDLNVHMHDRDRTDEIILTNEKISTLAKDPTFRSEPTTKILQRLDTSKDPRRESTIRREYNRLRNIEIGKLKMSNHPEFVNYLVFENELFVVFANKNKVSQLTKFDYVLMDGTFRSSPPDYQQVYTIHTCCLNK